MGPTWLRLFLGTSLYAYADGAIFPRLIKYEQASEVLLEFGDKVSAALYMQDAHGRMLLNPSDETAMWLFVASYTVFVCTCIFSTIGRSTLFSSFEGAFSHSDPVYENRATGAVDHMRDWSSLLLAPHVHLLLKCRKSSAPQSGDAVIIGLLTVLWHGAIFMGIWLSGSELVLICVIAMFFLATLTFNCGIACADTILTDMTAEDRKSAAMEIPIYGSMVAFYMTDSALADWEVTAFTHKALARALLDLPELLMDVIDISAYGASTFVILDICFAIFMVLYQIIKRLVLCISGCVTEGVGGLDAAARNLAVST